MRLAGNVIHPLGWLFCGALLNHAGNRRNTWARRVNCQTLPPWKDARSHAGRNALPCDTTLAILQLPRAADLNWQTPHLRHLETCELRALPTHAGAAAISNRRWPTTSRGRVCAARNVAHRRRQQRLSRRLVKPAIADMAPSAACAAVASTVRPGLAAMFDNDAPPAFARMQLDEPRENVILWRRTT